MEVEVKLHLQDARAHQAVWDVLSPFHVKTHLQENVFFDGCRLELSSKRAILRLRFYNEDNHCVISLKARASIVDGINRVEEDEEPVDPAVARAWAAEPSQLSLIKDTRIMKRVFDEFFDVYEDVGFTCLGGFRNIRAVFDWEGFALELDETQYDFGTSYEIECESVQPDKAKKLMVELLVKHGVPYQYSKLSKFAIFRSGRLPAFESSTG